MVHPESVWVTLDEEVIQLITRCGPRKWWNTSNKDKHQHSDGKHVYSLTIVLLACVLLWGPVCTGSTHSLEHARAVTALSRCTHTEIGELQRKVVRDQDVFRLHVSVGDSIVVAIGESFDHLEEKALSDALRNCAQLQVIEQLSITHELKGNVRAWDLNLLLWLEPGCIGTVLHDIYQARVIELTQHFCLQLVVRNTTISEP